MNIVPEINYLMELDPTHIMCQSPNDCQYTGGGTCEFCELIDWPVYEEAKGG